MLKKDFVEDLVVVQCDSCEQFERLSDCTTVKEGIKKLREEIWWIVKYDGKFEHYCPNCLKKNTKKIRERKKYASDVDIIEKAPDTIYGACSQCKGDLVLRESKHGKFYGCQRFPKCKQTVKVDFAVKYLLKKKED